MMQLNPGLHRARISTNGSFVLFGIFYMQVQRVHAPCIAIDIISASQLEDVDNACLVTTKCVGEVLSPKSHLAEQVPRTPRTASQMHTIQAAQ